MYHPDEILGAYDGLILIIDDNVPFLLSKGVTAATVKAPLVASRGLLSADKFDRDNKKAALAGSQTKYEGDGASVYDQLSDAIDTLAGIFGKKTAKGKQILALRTGVIGKKKKASSSSTSGSSSSNNSSSSS